jgi:competence protein ComEC
MNIAFLMSVPSLLTKNRRFLALVGAPLIVLFMAVVGFNPPVVRAGVMQLFLLAAPLFKRENDAVTTMSFSLAVILLFNPYGAVGAGLQLSFAATAGILLFSGGLFERLDAPLRGRAIYKNAIIRRPARFVVSCFASTVGALSLSLPLIALHFGTVSLVAPLSNLLVLPAVSMAFIGGIFAVLLGAVLTPRFPRGISCGLSALCPACPSPPRTPQTRSLSSGLSIFTPCCSFFCFSVRLVNGPGSPSACRRSRSVPCFCWRASQRRTNALP